MEGAHSYALPLLAIDKVEDLQPGAIRTVKAIAGNEAYFSGHYPGNPIFPGVFTLETIHQAVRYYVAKQFPTCERARMTRIRVLRLLAPLRPGDRLEVSCQCTYVPEQHELEVRATCQISDLTLAAEARLCYTLEGEVTTC